MKRVLILGGTRFFGISVAQFFYEDGWDVTLFTRGNVQPSNLPSHNAIHGDRKCRSDLETAARQGPWDVVVDNIAYEGPSVAASVRILCPKTRYILTSTVSVYRYVQRPYTQPLLEDMVDFDYEPSDEDRKNEHWIYARGKLEAERAVRVQRVTPWTILRPTVVYGPYDSTSRGWWYLTRLLDGEGVLLPDSGNYSFRLAFSHDVAKAVLMAVNSPNTVGRTYNIAQSEIITLRDFIEESAKALQITPKIINVPLEKLGSLAGPYGNLQNFIPDISKAVADFSFSPTPWQEFAAITTRWFQDRWNGERAEILATRAEEIEFSRQWRVATSRFPVRHWE